MTEHDITVAKDIGALQADMRTVKHDVATISAKIDGLASLITKTNVQQAKGMGFWGGITFAISVSGLIIGGVFTLVKMVVGTN